ncbi:hypothetical protein BKA70DRAFT_55606 [Coprinopsis sp. MPI-PUGE-AT-0042]|nr:hypothetical protein BKA70DRAFT_55606 [Coprinopsis sp. MPI-PUGE-AT-0042]
MRHLTITFDGHCTCGRIFASGYQPIDPYGFCARDRECPPILLTPLILARPRSLAINAVEAHAAASTTPVSVGFLCIRYRNHTKFTVRDLLEVLVKQTVERHPASLPPCNELYDRHIREKTEPLVKELVGLLKRFTSELRMTTFYFLDALDEAPNDVQLDLLESLASLFLCPSPPTRLEWQHNLIKNAC